MKDLPYILWTFTIGLLPVAQAGINASLSNKLGGPLRAGMTNFIVGGVVLVAAVVLFNLRGRTEPLADVPWWNWLGGLMGALFVMTGIIVAPRIGATLLFALLICGQVVASVVIDWQGWFGYAARPVHVGRLVGVALVIAGVAMVSAYR